MFRVISVDSDNKVAQLEELLNEGWKIHDKTATRAEVIYVLWKDSRNHPSGTGN